MQIHSIPGKLDVQWDAEVKAMVDTWSSYFLTLEEFRQAVMVKGLTFAKANGARAWVVDSSRAERDEAGRGEQC